MNDFITECNETISKVQELLKQNPEWQLRFKGHAEAIEKNLGTIKKNKSMFNEWAPLHLYMTISEAKNKMIHRLRFLGQDVASLKIENDKITISTKSFEANNKRDFDCNKRLEDCKWKSQEAKEFRSHFSHKQNRNKISKKRNEEHRLESLFLSEFSKKKSKEKILCNIQPVKIAGIARFQMATPLSASNLKKMKYSNGGGGIDILSRVGSGKSTKLCIMEVKDENKPKEPPTKAIQQGLAYATFLRELLRSSSGENWWKIFGFGGKIPNKLEFNVACIMPFGNNKDVSFRGKTVKFKNDSFHFHYIYFQEKNNKIEAIETSLEKK